MATKVKVTDLTTAPALANGDILHVVDVSDTTDDPAGSSRKVTLAAIKAFFGVVATAWGTITGDITNQADLAAALSAKANAAATTTALAGKAPLSHTHAQAEITGLIAALGNKLEADDIANFVTNGEMNAAIAALVDSAPGTLDTLNELAAALGDDPNLSATLTTLIGTKANSADLHAVALSGDYDDLENAPTIPSGTMANESADDYYTITETEEAIESAIEAIPPSGLITLLARVPVSFNDLGVTPLYTVPEGKRLIVTDVIVRILEADSVTNPANIGVGAIAGNSDIVPANYLNAQNYPASGLEYAFNLAMNGVQRSALPGEVINMEVFEKVT